MREIKFRAWDTYNERMVDEPEKFIPTGPHHYTDDPRFNSPFQYYETWQDIEDGVHRPCHIMQYTGKKDKNGKEIWEGDILKVDWQDPRYESMIVEAEWNDHEAGWSFGAGATSEVYWSHEVIGNIYQHPHLIPATPNTP